MNDIKLTTLADKAMLVRVKIGVWSNYRKDDNATALVELSKGVTKAGNFNKHLMKESKILRDVTAAYRAVYLYHINNSVPWLDDGVRMIPAGMYFEYIQNIKQLINEADQAADRMQLTWAVEVANDMQRLGSLANADDYPRTVRDKFYVDGPRFMPVPKEDDFRVEISDEDRASLGACIREAEEAVSRHLITEMLDPVRKAVEKLQVPIGEAGAVFRDSMLTNIQDQIIRATKLNINNDPVVNDLILELNTAVGSYATNPDPLRESDKLREDTKEKLADVMAKMSAFMGVR